MELSGSAKSNLIILSITHEDLMKASEENREIFNAIARVHDFLNEFGGVPPCDYIETCN